MALKNGIILITGATSGFGEATARLITKEWPLATLWITGRRKERLEKLVQEIGPNRSKAFAFDISSRAEVENFLAQNSAELKNISVLVNNAGLAAGLDNFQDASLDDFEQMIDTNVKGLIYITRGILPSMIARGEGHIINMGSVAGRYTYAKGNVYSATKFAVHSLTESLRIDLLGKNIRVTTIAPGMATTEFSKVRFKGDEKKAEAVYQGVEALSAHDVAETILWCLDRPAHVNIQELVIYPTAQAAPREVARR
ncbi:MAG: SDR family NAD(P)-dependent oxidoreductase [Bdellovibrionota bacterium]